MKNCRVKEQDQDRLAMAEGEAAGLKALQEGDNSPGAQILTFVSAKSLTLYEYSMGTMVANSNGYQSS